MNHAIEAQYPFKCTTPLQLRFNDVDALGHVNNSVYFQFFDQGRLTTQVQTLLEMPEYRAWISQMTQGEDADEMVNTMLGMFASPARATMQMMWMNCIVALLLMLPTALLGMAGNARKTE